MTLNTFWFQRMQTRYKTRSPIAATGHWLITKFSFVDTSTGKRYETMEQPIDIEFCALPVPTGTGFHIALHEWKDEPFEKQSDACVLCRRARLKFVAQYGLAAYRMCTAPSGRVFPK